MGILEIQRKVTPIMTQKEPAMAMLFCFNKTSSPLSTPSSSIIPSPLRTFSESMMEENIEDAEAMITKWDLDASTYTCLLQGNRKEAKDFIKCIKDLRRAMHFLVSEKSGSDKLMLAQNLMKKAMKRMEMEFYRILSVNQQYLDPESVSSRSSRLSARPQSLSSESDYEDYSGESEVEKLSDIAMSDLKLIADCMISSGYGMECVKIYKIIRSSIVDEELYRLGIERYNSLLINKMNSGDLEPRIKNWLNAMKIAVKTIFHGERFLCDHVFTSSNTIRESCFRDVIKQGAINFFRFPELVAKSKRLPEKIFRLMDLYKSISDHLPEIESIFSFESISAVKLQALNSLLKLGDSVRMILSEFQLSIQNSSKTSVLGGGIHPLTNSVMNYLSLLANHGEVLTDIVAYPTSPTESLLPGSYFESPNSGESPTPTVSVQLAWIVLLLLCKLDSMAELYNDTALSYLFLANNLHFIIEVVCTTNLKCFLGDEWVAKHKKKAKQYAANYEAMAWTKVFSSVPENSDAMSPETVKRYFRQFKLAFKEVYQKQMSWVVPNGTLRDEIRVSIAKKIVPAYRELYDAHLATLSGEENLEVLVRFAPDNLEKCLSDLFNGTEITGSLWSLSPSSSQSLARAEPGFKLTGGKI